ncbi:MAG: AAA family ATPase [Coriobacteriia bacterium]|nr:AAA family ATPase [Coriobacteriia bacterium]
MAAIIIVDRDPEFASKLKDLLSRESGQEILIAPSAGRLTEQVTEADAQVVVFGPSTPLEAALEAVEALSARTPLTGSVLVVPKITTELMRQAMRAGFSDVVGAGGTFGEVASAVLETNADIAKRRASSGLSGMSPQARDNRGKVVTVFSMKGGVGKTVIASNLGVALAGELGLRTVLLDLDLQFGDTGIMLQIKPERTIYDAIQVYDRLDSSMLRGFLTHHKSGLDVLLAPVRPEEAESVTASRLSHIIELLREIADIVIIDTPAAFDENVLTAIDKSDEIYAVATMDVASIKNTRISLQKLRQLGYDETQVKLALNRADSKVWLEPSEVEHAVAGQIAVRIPSDRLVPRSVNKGVPVVIDAPKSAVARSLVDMARKVAPVKEAKTDVA